MMETTIDKIKETLESFQEEIITEEGDFLQYLDTYYIHEIAEKIVKNIAVLDSVSNRRELLKAFAEWCNKHTIAQPIAERNIENYLGSL